MAVPTETITTENVVASTAVDQELNLDALRVDLSRADYDPDRFPGLIYRTIDSKAASLVFRSGEVVTTESRSEPDAHGALEILFGELDDLGVIVPDSPTVTVQNIVSTADLGSSLNLNAIAVGLGLERIEYEPEQFPGLVYRMDEPSVLLLLFGSGKLVITGATWLAEAEHAVERIHSRLDEVGLLD
jgi:transcription initiation factor TFIID TATA-box-binding protein